MKTKDYRLIEAYMLSCMRDSAHDREHIYRVLYAALDIASFEEPVDSDVLIAACLLHDIGSSLKIRPYAMRPWGRKRRWPFSFKMDFRPLLRRRLLPVLKGIGFGPTARRSPRRKRFFLTPTSSM